MPAHTRRRLLAGGATGLAALAGCTTTAPETEGTEETPAPGPFVIRNRSERSQLVSVTLRREGEVLLDRTYDLDPGGRQELGNPVDEQGRYELAVELGTGTKDSATWTLGGCERIEHVVIVISQAGTVTIETERGTVEPTACR